MKAALPQQALSASSSTPACTPEGPQGKLLLPSTGRHAKRLNLCWPLLQQAVAALCLWAVDGATTNDPTGPTQQAMPSHCRRAYQVLPCCRHLDRCRRCIFVLGHHGGRSLSVSHGEHGVRARGLPHGSAVSAETKALVGLGTRKNRRQAKSDDFRCDLRQERKMVRLVQTVVARTGGRALLCCVHLGFPLLIFWYYVHQLFCSGTLGCVDLCARVPKGSEGVDVAVIGQWPQSLLPSSSALVCPPPKPGQSAETTGAPITCKAAVAWAAGAPLSA